MPEDKPEDTNEKSNGGFGESGGYFSQDNEPKKETEDSPSVDMTNSSPEEAPGSAVPPSQPSVDNFSAPGQEQASPSSPETTSPGELRMPSEGEISEEKKAPQTEGPTEDIFEKKEESVEVSKPQVEEKPEEPRIQKKETETEQKLEGIKPEKKGGFFKCCIISLIVFVIIILGLGALVYINETGIWDNGLEKYYGQIGLERLWGGLGEDGKAAMTSAVNKMSEKKNFAIKGQSQFNLEVPATDTEESGAAETVVLADDDAITDAEWFRILGVEENAITALINQGFDISTKIDIVGKVQDKNKYEITFSSGLIDLIRTITGGSGDFNLVVARDGDSTYVKSTALNTILESDKEWLKVTANEDQTGLTSVISLASIVTSGERTGTEKIDDVSCYVYEFKINGSQLGQYLEGQLPLISDMISEISVVQAKAYIGKKDHLIRKFEINASESSGNISLSHNITLTFSGFGATKGISFPDEEDAKQESWQTIKSYFTGAEIPSGKTIAEKDAQRKEDLNDIKVALQSYKEAKGNFPSTSGEIIKTRDQDTILSRALVPDYLASLPVDPENDKYYYGYSSDGENFKLTAVLENKDDPEGEAAGDYWLYIIEL